jgi:hypothetical protein
LHIFVAPNVVKKGLTPGITFILKTSITN